MLFVLCGLPVACICPLLVVDCLLLAGYWPLFDVRCSLCVVCCLFVWPSLFVGRCALFVVR